MAFVKSSVKFTLSGLNFNTLKDGDVELENNVNRSYKGEVYEDVINVRDESDSGASFGGTGFGLDGNDNVTGGRVQVIAGFVDGNDVFYIQGMDIGAKRIERAIDSRSFTDDLAIWEDVFSGKDQFVFGSAADNMRGFAGADTMKGGGGGDKLKGDGGNDKLFGQKGADELNGGGGADVLEGGAGKDRLIGGRGNDKLEGGADQDKMTGGGGNDRFVFRKEGISNEDRITDFQLSRDKIVIRTSDNSTDDLVIYQNAGGNAVISYSDGSITLIGISQQQVENNLDIFAF